MKTITDTDEAKPTETGTADQLSPKKGWLQGSCLRSTFVSTWDTIIYVRNLSSRNLATRWRIPGVFSRKGDVPKSTKSRDPDAAEGSPSGQQRPSSADMIFKRSVFQEIGEQLLSEAAEDMNARQRSADESPEAADKPVEDSTVGKSSLGIKSGHGTPEEPLGGESEVKRHISAPEPTKLEEQPETKRQVSAPTDTPLREGDRVKVIKKLAQGVMHAYNPFRNTTVLYANGNLLSPVRAACWEPCIRLQERRLH